MCCWIWVLVFCWEFLHLYSSWIMICDFLVVSLTWYQDNAGLMKVFFDPSAVFVGRIFKRLVLILLWKYDRNHPRNLLVMGFSMMGSFWLLIIKAPYLLLVCLNFSDSSWFNFCRLYVSRSFSISFRLPSLFNSVHPKEISPEYSLERLMLKLKLQYFSHLTHFKTPCFCHWLKSGGEGDGSGWDGWMASLTQGTWVLVSSRSLWWTAEPGVLLSIGSQRVGHDWATELNWINWVT